MAQQAQPGIPERIDSIPTAEDLGISERAPRSPAAQKKPRLKENFVPPFEEITVVEVGNKS